jgi:lipoate-protein ligase A
MTDSTKIWRLIDDGPRPGAENMARDEAMALCCGPRAPATLRAYRFEPPAVTVGRFQRLPGGINLDGCPIENIDMVRRATGGLAILHINDFTYSVVMRSGNSGPQERDRNFNLVAGAILRALKILGVDAHQVSHLRSRTASADWCFEGIFGVDIEWNGRKICGSAQKLFENSVLQHGSLILQSAEETQLRVSGQRGSEGGSSQPFVTLAEAMGGDLTWDEVLGAFRDGFESSLGVTLEPGEFSKEERESARRLMIEKYSDHQWLWHPDRPAGKTCGL